MKILLQNQETGLFLRAPSGWTNSIEEGLGFVNSGGAMDFAFEHKLADVDVVLWFKEQHYRIVLPFGGREDEEANNVAAKAQDKMI